MIDTNKNNNVSQELRFLDSEQIKDSQNKAIMTKYIADAWQTDCPIKISSIIGEDLQPIVCDTGNNIDCLRANYQLSIGTVNNVLAVYVKFNLIIDGNYDLRYRLSPTNPAKLVKCNFKLASFTPFVLKDLQPKAQEYCLSFASQIADIILSIFKTQVDNRISKQRSYLQNHLIDSLYDNYNLREPLFDINDYLMWLSAPADDKMFKNGRTAFLADNITYFTQCIISHKNVDEILANSPNMINTLISIYLSMENQPLGATSIVLLNKVLHLVANKQRLIEEINGRPLIHLILRNSLTNATLPFTFLIQGKSGINKVVSWFIKYPNQTLQFKIMNETDVKSMINHVIDRHLKADPIIELIKSKQIKVDLNQQEKIIRKYLKLIKRDWADVHVFNYVTALLNALLAQK